MMGFVCALMSFGRFQPMITGIFGMALCGTALVLCQAASRSITFPLAVLCLNAAALALSVQSSIARPAPRTNPAVPVAYGKPYKILVGKSLYLKPGDKWMVAVDKDRILKTREDYESRQKEHALQAGNYIMLFGLKAGTHQVDIFQNDQHAFTGDIVVEPTHPNDPSVIIEFPAELHPPGTTGVFPLDIPVPKQ